MKKNYLLINNVYTEGVYNFLLLAISIYTTETNIFSGQLFPISVSDES